MPTPLADTHCHIHEATRPLAGDDPTRALWAKATDANPDHIIARALEVDVTRMICVGTTLSDTKIAIEFVQPRNNVWASIGLHPHEAKEYAGSPKKLQEFAALATKPKVVAVGECGLDFYYNHSSKEDQEKVLRFQIELAIAHNLPMIFHIRDAFDDFWPIFDSYPRVRGVVHSFSASEKELGQILKRDLYVGLNGIITFTKHVKQLDAAKAVPLERLLLETDAPFLTPQGYRGTICEPKHVRVTAEFLSELRHEPLETLAATTTHNAQQLFGI